MIQTHIWLDEYENACIDETNTKVVEIVKDVLAYGWSPEEIHFQHPHLSLAQIHAALAYYYDNQQQLDAQIADQLVDFERQRTASLHIPMRQRLIQMTART